MQAFPIRQKRHSKSSQLPGDSIKVERTSLQTKTQFTYNDKLTLHPLQPSVVRLVPKPKSAYVNNGLPKWNSTSLDLKIPIIPGPDGNIILSRGKLGKKLWAKSLDDFILHDPHCKEVPLEYNPVHDPHLRQWFRNPRNREVLMKLDVISSGLDAHCTIKEYNDYRKYLWRLYRNAVNRQIAQKDKEETEKQVYLKAKCNLDKENEKYLKLEKTAIIRKEKKHKMELTRKVNEDNCKRRLLRVDERIIYLEKQKQEIKRSLANRTKALNDKIQYRVKRAQILERENKIKTLWKWHNEDVAKKNQDEENEKKRKEKLLFKAKKRWDDKVNNQQMQIIHEAFLRQQIAIRKEHFIKKYEAKMRYLHTNIEEQLLLRKSKQVLENTAKRHADKTKQVILSVSNAWAGKGECTVENARKYIAEKLTQMHLNFEPYILISEAKQLLESHRRRRHVPTEVQLVIKWLLESAIATYTAEEFKKTIVNMSQKILSIVQNIKEPSQIRCVESHDDSNKSVRHSKLQDKKRGFGSIEIGKGNIMEIESIIKKTVNSSCGNGRSIENYRQKQLSDIQHFIGPSASLKPVLKNNESRTTFDKLSLRVQSFGADTRVSFGQTSAIVIPHFEDENDLKSVKSRIPTPIPSLTTLTNAVFDETDIEEHESYFATVFIEKNKLLESIHQVSKNVMKIIDKRLQKFINRNYKFQRENINKNKKSEMPGPLIQLCSAVLFKPSDENLPSIADAVILNVLKDINMSPSNLKHLQKNADDYCKQLKTEINVFKK